VLGSLSLVMALATLWALYVKNGASTKMIRSFENGRRKVGKNDDRVQRKASCFFFCCECLLGYLILSSFGHIYNQVTSCGALRLFD